MRVYLDQRLKFWLAFMGFLTLAYVQLGGGLQGFVKKEQQHNETTEPAMRRPDYVVMLHRSSDYDNEVTISVGNAQQYARAAGYDFRTVGRDWQSSVLKAAQEYKGGIILLDGSPRSRPEDVVNLPTGWKVEKIGTVSGKLSKKILGLVLKASDFDNALLSGVAKDEDAETSAISVCADMLGDKAHAIYLQHVT